MMDQMPLPLPAPDAYPQFWIMKRCLLWDAAKNRRFRLLRIDGPSDHIGHYPSHIWDAELSEWRSQHVYGGTAGHEIARKALPREIPTAARKEAR